MIAPEASGSAGNSFQIAARTSNMPTTIAIKDAKSRMVMFGSFA
jgi:hypothetical protein